METPTAQVAVIGGSGFYEFLTDASEHRITTPYGDPSAPISVASLGGRSVAFLPRHGVGHTLGPHAINYRANLWALASLGVRQVLAPCAVGGLRDTVAPGDLIVPDQLVDRTWGRAGSFSESGTMHLPFADPYCPRLLERLGGEEGVRVGGTMVVIPGPRFSTRAESRDYAASGWDLINMTAAPEAALARELRMCLAAIAVVTDMDAGAQAEEAVDAASVFARFAESLDRVRDLLGRVIESLPDPEACTCSTWAEGAELDYLP